MALIFKRYIYLLEDGRVLYVGNDSRGYHVSKDEASRQNEADDLRSASVCQTNVRQS